MNFYCPHCLRHEALIKDDMSDNRICKFCGETVARFEVRNQMVKLEKIIDLNDGAILTGITPTGDCEKDVFEQIVKVAKMLIEKWDEELEKASAPEDVDIFDEMKRLRKSLQAGGYLK